MARTLLTIKQQNDFLQNNWRLRTLVHKWSVRGYGNSKILNDSKEVISKAGGCGYDRYGKVLGDAVMAIFPEEVHKLAKRECKGRRRDRKGSEKFYGLFFNSLTDQAWIDGACGSSCVEKILNKIGFSLLYVGDCDCGQSGQTFYQLVPVTKNHRFYL